MFSILSLFKAIAGICNTPPLEPGAWKVDGNRLIISAEGLQKVEQPGAAVYMAGNSLSRPVLLIRTNEGKLRAYTSVCTHAKRKLDYFPAENKLRCCSVNHSTFDLNGQKLTGPAKGNITEYKLNQEADKLFIFLE
jgi:nitrite reductase/ring-hydroxylating ferredoxin subunit